MPIRRRADKRRGEVTDEHEEWLRGNDKASGFIQYAPNDELAALWNTHSERIVAQHVALYPALDRPGGGNTRLLSRASGLAVPERQLPTHWRDPDVFIWPAIRLD